MHSPHREMVWNPILFDVEEGGGTNFPYLNVTVQPKKGSAVLWPHGLNSDPRIKDTRTHHEAMPS